MPKLEKGKGKGWHGESERHSRAVRLGHAGGKYRSKGSNPERIQDLRKQEKLLKRKMKDSDVFVKRLDEAFDSTPNYKEQERIRRAYYKELKVKEKYQQQLGVVQMKLPVTDPTQHRNLIGHSSDWDGTLRSYKAEQFLEQREPKTAEDIARFLAYEKNKDFHAPSGKGKLDWPIYRVEYPFFLKNKNLEKYVKANGKYKDFEMNNRTHVDDIDFVATIWNLSPHFQKKYPEEGKKFSGWHDLRRDVGYHESKFLRLKKHRKKTTTKLKADLGSTKTDMQKFDELRKQQMRKMRSERDPRKVSEAGREAETTIHTIRQLRRQSKEIQTVLNERKIARASLAKRTSRVTVPSSTSGLIFPKRKKGQSVSEEVRF